MKKQKENLIRDELSDEQKPIGTSRREFLGRVGKLGLTAAALGTIGGAPFLAEKAASVEAATGNSESPGRMNDCFNYRKNAAIAMRVNVGSQKDNGDAARFSDFSGNYSKALPHDSLGIPNGAAYLSLRYAYETGNHSDFNNLIIGTPGGGGNSRLNGPQLALAFDLEGIDSHATIIPAAPSVASAQTAAEQVEHYWGAILRDVPFADYGTNSLVGQAVADINNMSFLSSSANNEFQYP